MTQNDHAGPTNRLALETSPYLLQHQFNPVDWWAWGPDAFAAAKAANKPVLLSVGYAACHWCHVMAHESFEDAETAALMNRLFVNIKVDREERPDVDQIYMAALHRLGEHGGWPLTMFLTPDAEPFWGGTYFPPEPRYGRPSFRQVLESIAKTYETDGEKVRYNTDLLKRLLTDEPDANVRLDLREEKLRYLVERFQTVMDGELGGLRGAPKFPQASFFGFLWRGGIRYGDEGAQAAIRHTLNRICQGGIYDHIGGGFARYSVDEFWLVPHFEKMLYDNAQLLSLLAEVWRETQDPLFAARARETVAWLFREMRGADSGFAASLDADSEGEEGKFYIWTPAEVLAVLGETDGAAFCATYDITDEGNFEGHAIPNLLGLAAPFDSATDARFAAMRARLLETRATRVRPGLDDKILADWNGLMIRALAHAGFVFGEPEWIAEARAAFAFVQARLTHNGRLMHSYRAGRLTAPASSADYANMIAAALTLYQVTSEAAYRDQAITWQGELDRHFWAETGGYYTSADDTADLIVRMRVANDDATPNANSTTVANLVALGMMTGEAAYEARARAVLDGFAADIGRNPVAHAGLLAAAIDLLAPCHVVVAGEGADGLVRGLARVSLPGAVIERLMPGLSLPASSPAATALAGMPAGSTFGVVCVGTTCHTPATTAEALEATARSARAVVPALS